MIGPAYRATTLRSFEVCALRTRAALQAPDVPTGFVESSGDLGTVFHAVAAEILKRLRDGRPMRQRMTTEEAIEVLYEVVPRTRIVLPTKERHELRWLVVAFSHYSWDPRRFLSIEERFHADVVGQDCVPRTVTGQPDLVVADPPEGIVIVDWKTGLAKPRVPKRHGRRQVVEGRKFLSDRENFQLDTYGLGMLYEYSSARYATLRNHHLRWGITTEATLYRNDLEHVERQLGDVMMMLDRAIAEGDNSKLWRPRPSAACANQCPVAQSCPVPMEQRGRGALASPVEADAAAARWVVLRAQADQLRKQLKSAHEETGYAPQVGDGTVVRWDPPTGKGRKFDVHPPVEVEPDERLDDAFAAMDAL